MKYNNSKVRTECLQHSVPSTIKKACLLLLLLMPLFASAQTQSSDDYGTWLSGQVSKSFLNRWTAGVWAEHRTCNQVSDLDCWFVRPFVAFSATSWLKIDAGYEYFRKADYLQHRAIASATGTLKSGNFSVSLRERFTYVYTPETDGNSCFMRSKLTTSYQIPNSCFRPYMATELFTWEHWQQTRHYVGCGITLSPSTKLDIFYLYDVLAGKAQKHLLGIGLDQKL